jgi:hypothetical protein
VIDAEELRPVRRMPPGNALVRRNLQDLEIVGVLILEVEGLDPA